MTALRNIGAMGKTESGEDGSAFRRERVVTVAILFANATVTAMDDHFGALIFRDVAGRGDGRRLLVVLGGVA